MISDRIQRTMMGIMLTVILYLVNINELTIASYLLTFMVVMVFSWAIFDFCPSTWGLRKIFKEECKPCGK